MTLRKKPRRPAPSRQLFSKPVPGEPNSFVVVEGFRGTQGLACFNDFLAKHRDRRVLEKKRSRNGSSNGAGGHHRS